MKTAGKLLAPEKGEKGDSALLFIAWFQMNRGYFLPA